MDEERQALLAQVSAMYYEQDMTQDKIGKQLGMSRVKVYRLLKEARAEGIIQITIRWPTQRNTRLEAALVETFDLKEALVLQTSRTAGSNLAPLGKLAAGYLEPLLQDSPTLAISLGHAVYETIKAIHPNIQAQVQVVQALGSIPQTMREYDSSMLVRLLAEKLGGDALYLTSPPMADTQEAAVMFRNQRDIEQVLLAASAADVALIGIGSLDPDTAGFVRAGFTSSEEMAQLLADGAVGEIAWRIYSQDGEPIPCASNHRVIGVSLAELKRIPTTIAIAQGQKKIPAILGALKAGVIDVLCTDDQTASGVLTLAQDGSPSA